MLNFKEKIKKQYSTLSTGMKKVGKYILDNPQDIALLSASQLGNAAGVSETTVIRFCYALEYSGYSQLQTEVRSHLIYSKSSLQDYQEKNEMIAGQPNFYRQSMKKDQSTIERMIEEVDEDDLHLAAKKIFDSPHVIVSGVRTSFAVAQWLSFTLNIVRGNSALYQAGVSDIIHLLSRIDSNSTVIIITFHRYSPAMIGLAEEAKKRGAFVIGITDSELAPIAEFSDVLLPVRVQSTIDSGPAVFSLVNALVAGVSVIDKGAFEARRNEYESTNPEKFFT